METEVKNNKTGCCTALLIRSLQERQAVILYSCNFFSHVLIPCGHGLCTAVYMSIRVVGGSSRQLQPRFGRWQAEGGQTLFSRPFLLLPSTGNAEAQGYCGWRNCMANITCHNMDRCLVITSQRKLLHYSYMISNRKACHHRYIKFKIWTTLQVYINKFTLYFENNIRRLKKLPLNTESKRQRAARQQLTNVRKYSFLLLVMHKLVHQFVLSESITRPILPAVCTEALFLHQFLNFQTHC